MIVFTCAENPADRVAVSTTGENVLVVIHSEDHDTGAELELTTANARTAAETVRAIVAAPEATTESIHGRLFTAPGGTPDTVYLSAESGTPPTHAVMLTHSDAAEFAGALDRAAAEADLARLGAQLREAAPLTLPAFTVDQLGRAAALILAAEIMGTRRARHVVESAHYIATGEVM